MPCACKKRIELDSLGSLASSEPGFARCCDCNGCCKDFSRGTRNPYWPCFCHPRWLPCRELYDFEPHDVCKPEDVCKHNDHCRPHPQKPPKPCRRCGHIH